MKKALLAVGIFGLAAGCSKEQPPPQYASSQTTGGAVGDTSAQEPEAPYQASPQAPLVQPGQEPGTSVYDQSTAETQNPSNPPSGQSAPNWQGTASGQNAPNLQNVQNAESGQNPPEANDMSRNAWRVDLIHAALNVSSLTPTQKAQIQALIDQKRSQDSNVRSARADLFGTLAGAVESGNVDGAAFSPKVQAVAAAIQADEPVNRSMLEGLHAILSPAQRTELANGAEARMQAMLAQHGNEIGWLSQQLQLTPTQQDQIATNVNSSEPPSSAEVRTQARQDHRRLLEAFKGDTFAVEQVVPSRSSQETAQWVQHVVLVAQSATPVLTPDQRETAAGMLRKWAAK